MESTQSRNYIAFQTLISVNGSIISTQSRNYIAFQTPCPQMYQLQSTQSRNYIAFQTNPLVVPLHDLHKVEII